MCDPMKQTTSIPTQKDLPDDRFFSAIGYLGILCFVPLLLKKDSAFATHHGRQGLVLLIAWVVLWIGMIVPILGQIVWTLGSLVLILLIILGMINALQGKLWVMPILGRYAKRIKL